MSAGTTMAPISVSARLYVWNQQHRGHEVEREVLYAVGDDALHLPPAPEITLRCHDCGDSLLIAV